MIFASVVAMFEYTGTKILTYLCALVHSIIIFANINANINTAFLLFLSMCGSVRIFYVSVCLCIFCPMHLILYFVEVETTFVFVLLLYIPFYV